MPESEKRKKELVFELFKKRKLLNFKEGKFIEILIDMAYQVDFFKESNEEVCLQAKKFLADLSPQFFLPLLDLLLNYNSAPGLAISDMPSMLSEVIEHFFLPSGDERPHLLDLLPKMPVHKNCISLPSDEELIPPFRKKLPEILQIRILKNFKEHIWQ